MYDHILVPTDGSDHVEPAVEYALDLAQHYDCTVHALHVVDSSPIERKLELTALDRDGNAWSIWPVQTDHRKRHRTGAP